MNRNKPTDLSRFFMVGINYKKTNAQVRGDFAINREQYESLLEKAAGTQVRELFVLSTCNRTEVYGFADEPGQLADLLCSQTAGTKAQFMELAYVKNDLDAVRHLFHVAAGLDSQILGDYEIVGQIRQAVKLAKENGFIFSFLERLTNQVLKASKLIKNQTALSDGTVSVSFAAVQYLKEKLADPGRSKVLVIGIGKIGRITCKNLKEYLNIQHITLMNRTEERASELAAELGLDSAPFVELVPSIRRADVILVASNATEPILLKEHLVNQGDKLVVDLSIPFNVDKEVATLPGVSLLTVDELSRLKDETLHKREAEIPKALAIIEEGLEEFREWVAMQKHVVILRAIKTKLEELHMVAPATSHAPARRAGSGDNIQRVINSVATKIRESNQPGCHYIEALHDYLATGTNN